jgi:predicted lipoprotein
MFILRAVVVCCCIALLGSCKTGSKDDYNRKALLGNLYTNIITPRFETFHTSVEALKASADAFVLSPGVAKLDSLKGAYYTAYKAFQAVEVYTFVPSMDLVTALNSFVPDTLQINNNIQSGSYNLSAVNNIRAKGFPAVDFLLFGNNESEVVSAFASANRKQYLSDIIQEIRDKATSSANGWGNFEADFVNASGTDVGSSVGMLVNDLSFDIERCRKERVGNALGYVGVVSTGIVVPDAVEAFYSNHSKELLIENLQQLKLLYEGGNGQGFDDYLSRLGADYYGTPLATAISNQFEKTIQAAQNVPGTFSVAVSTNNAEMQTLFLELKKLTVMIKVDMSSQLGVIINYSDNDGD